MVVDIRTVPRSRTNPQYNLDALPKALAACQIGHTRIEELGGLRSKSTDVPPEVNGWWENQSFHNYADYAMSDEFRRGLAQLVDLGRERRRSEEHTSELQSLMRISYAVLCLETKKNQRASITPT